MSYIPDAISVVIPTYNRAHLIRESLQSVLDQTLQPYEIIVVDDFSTDDTEEVVNSLNSPLIKYVKNQRKKGANGARNTGILMAQGEFIAFHDSDDIWLPEKLELQKNIFKDTDIDLCFCSMLSDNEKIPNLHIENEMFEKLKKSNFISTQTIMIKNELINDYLFDENLNRFQDWDVVLRLAQDKKNIFHLDVILVSQNVGGERI
ncbi:glycosyltransferase family 2 protein, partial [Acinetobacter puyangensis]|uniref:glycosyltransferase family 2 protein n=1 Tax=Acinetobacter puyangensis TaxID=1096779 RepID=UPI003A4DBD97